MAFTRATLHLPQQHSTYLVKSASTGQRQAYRKLGQKLCKPQRRALAVTALSKERVVLIPTNDFTSNFKASKYSNPIGIIALLVVAVASVAPYVYGRWRQQQRLRAVAKGLGSKPSGLKGRAQSAMQTELQQLVATLARGKSGQVSFRSQGSLVSFHPTTDSSPQVAKFLSGLKSSEFKQYSSSTDNEGMVQVYLRWAANGKQKPVLATSAATSAKVAGSKAAAAAEAL